ncbi:hypothetical protein BX600DRAFT_512963 [Xylariales sp. PMI_506]|nr:hypothetical protein BX600DRAFT_512963 [Xylariales sp. PMI_506]
MESTLATNFSNHFRESVEDRRRIVKAEFNSGVDNLSEAVFRDLRNKPYLNESSSAIVRHRKDLINLFRTKALDEFDKLYTLAINRFIQDSTEFLEKAEIAYEKDKDALILKHKEHCNTLLEKADEEQGGRVEAETELQKIKRLLAKTATEKDTLSAEISGMRATIEELKTTVKEHEEDLEQCQKDRRECEGNEFKLKSELEEKTKDLEFARRDEERVQSYYEKLKSDFDLQKSQLGSCQEENKTRSAELENLSEKIQYIDSLHEELSSLRRQYQDLEAINSAHQIAKPKIEEHGGKSPVAVKTMVTSPRAGLSAAVDECRLYLEPILLQLANAKADSDGNCDNHSVKLPQDRSDSENILKSFGNVLGWAKEESQKNIRGIVYRHWLYLRETEASDVSTQTQVQLNIGFILAAMEESYERRKKQTKSSEESVHDEANYATAGFHGDLETLQDTVYALEAELEAVRGTLLVTTESNENSEVLIGKLRSDLADVKAQYQITQTRLGEQEDQKAEFEREILQLREANFTSEETNVSPMDHHQIQSDLAEMKTQYNTAQALIENLKDENTNHEQEIRQLKESNSKLSSSSQGSKTSSDLESDLRESEALYYEAGNYAQKLEGEIMEHQTAITGFKVKLEKATRVLEYIVDGTLAAESFEETEDRRQDNQLRTLIQWGMKVKATVKSALPQVAISNCDRKFASKLIEHRGGFNFSGASAMCSTKEIDVNEYLGRARGLTPTIEKQFQDIKKEEGTPQQIVEQILESNIKLRSYHDAMENALKVHLERYETMRRGYDKIQPNLQQALESQAKNLGSTDLSYLGLKSARDDNTDQANHEVSQEVLTAKLLVAYMTFTDNVQQISSEHGGDAEVDTCSEIDEDVSEEAIQSLGKPALRSAKATHRRVKFTRPRIKFQYTPRRVTAQLNRGMLVDELDGDAKDSVWSLPATLGLASWQGWASFLPTVGVFICLSLFMLRGANIMDYRAANSMSRSSFMDSQPFVCGSFAEFGFLIGLVLRWFSAS